MNLNESSHQWRFLAVGIAMIVQRQKEVMEIFVSRMKVEVLRICWWLTEGIGEKMLYTNKFSVFSNELRKQ